jgi:hypothetical protein
MNTDWNDGFEAGISWHKESIMNQYDPKHYYFHRQDPYKFGYWHDPLEVKPTVKEVVIGSITFIVALIAIGSVLFLN